MDDTECIVAKAIRDGGIDAEIDHEEGWVTSRSSPDVYATADPQVEFHERIAFCLDIHNEVRSSMASQAHNEILPLHTHPPPTPHTHTYACTYTHTLSLSLSSMGQTIQPCCQAICSSSNADNLHVVASKSLFQTLIWHWAEVLHAHTSDQLPHSLRHLGHVCRSSASIDMPA